MKLKFYVKDIPKPWPILQWVLAHSDLQYYYDYMKPVNRADALLNLKHQIDIDQLAVDTMSMLKQYGFHGWKSAIGTSNEYGGLSLAMDPDHIEDKNPNCQTLGSSINLPSEFLYYEIDKFESVKNTYYDHWSFRHHAPCVANSNLKGFLDGFSKSPIRSRLAVINPEYVEDAYKELFWHRDEPVFENLRINIPIETDETFMFQIKDQDPVHLQYGNMYSWDTNILHRVYPTTKLTKSRTHLVLGFCPWFDYNQEEDSFTSNEFYGEMHPIDMLVNGHIHPLIKGLN